LINAIDFVIFSYNKIGSFSAESLCYDDYKNCANLMATNCSLKNERWIIEQDYTDEIFSINGEELLSRCHVQYKSFLRYINYKYWRDRNKIVLCQHTPKKITFSDIEAIAHRLFNVQNLEREAKRLSAITEEKQCTPIETFARLYDQIAVPICWFSRLFENEEVVFSKPLGELRSRIINCIDNFSALEDYIDYCDMIKKSLELGVGNFICQISQAKLPAEAIVPAFNKCFYNSLLDVSLPRFNAVNKFRKQKHEDNIASFKELDLAHMEISKAALLSRLISALPSFDNFTSEHDEIGLLKRELAKQRKVMPIRKLFVTLPNLLPVLKPCMIMSPLAVSTYLGDTNYEFDTVIFDEASQIRTEDAICALSRAKQAIVAGDSKQLPPTDFFNTSTPAQSDVCDEYENSNDDCAFESLLDEASFLPSMTLKWHYRSRHEHLITFSNTNLYGDNLITFPSPVEKGEDIGVEYIYVPNGTYDRGGRNGNRAEAERVAELVFEHLYKNPDRSLGVVAFGEAQQTAILAALIQKRRSNPMFEEYFNDDLEESIFIKNLETVQGDERDTIIFSIGYAQDAAGKFAMNFGPLGRNGGERRLNVAITRAKYNVKLVGSIKPFDIDLERITGEGPKMLRAYIDFAINGGIASTNRTKNNLTPGSLFERTVYDYLIAKGYNVEMQIGCSEYKIDLAVRCPHDSNKYIIGIECDGVMYNSARTARERDRLRQAVLENMGWKMYRVWSTDWVKDPKNEGKKLFAAINDAINNTNETTPAEAPNSVQAGNYLNISANRKKQEKFPRPKYFGHSANEIPLDDFENIMYDIVSGSYGIDKEGLFRTTALCYGWHRRGDSIKFCLERAYQQLLKNSRIREINGKVKAG